MEEVLKEFYRCRICDEPITYPKKLRCQHVFCHECLVLYITEFYGKASFPCPVCGYKHLPEEQESVVSQDTLLILEEDTLMKDVQQFFKNGEEPEAMYSVNNMIPVSCNLHDEYMYDYFCVNCNMLACHKCRREMHVRCELHKIDKGMHMKAFNNSKEVAEQLTNFLSETEELHNILNTKIGNIVPDPATHDETIKLYYSELREKVVQYLAEQERKVLEKAKELRENEIAYLERDAVVCDKMASSVKLQQELALAVQKQITTHAPQNLVVTNHLRKNLERFKTMFSQLQSDIDTEYNVRFIVNTELEDKLADTDIVKIEIVDCCHMDACAVTFQEDAVVDQQVRAELDSALSTPDRSSLMTTQHEEMSPPLPPEEPPPTYNSVARQSFIQRRRPLNSSVIRRQPSASAPPLSALDDMPGPSSRLHYSPSTQVHYPSADGRSTVQPSAPPLSLSASSEPFDSPQESTFTPIPLNAQTVTMFKYLTKIDTVTDKDEFNPSLMGIVSLGEFFVVADKKNKCLKRFRSDGFGSLVDQFYCASEPWDVAGISDTLCVVTAPEEGDILFVSFADTPGETPAKLEFVMETGKYISIGYCRDKDRLICGRGPPFSAARIDILTMRGDIVQKIDLMFSMTVPRSLLMSTTTFLVFCDVRKNEVEVYDIKNSKNSPEVVRRYGHDSLKDPQGIALLPVLKSILILDASSGNVFITSYSGHARKVVHGDIKRERLGGHEVQYTISVSNDQKILAVAHYKGKISFYEIRYM
ncbi:RING finger protein nhl-1-like [Ylistrum balloti]|uniref:RING finger protein nhl-1-like n=1 Tax=Ylistrum balloti TaxID=509963 RepID=UPI002905AA2C|nr:RING finger protein nhl-1-like [Ylistrum balloti]